MSLTRLILGLLAITALSALADVVEEDLQANNRNCLQAILVDSHSPQAYALNGQAIRILNWNIQKSTQTGWVEDLRRLSIGADLVLLQEATLEAELRKKMEGENHAVFAPGYTTEEYSSGVLTASKVAPQAHCTLSHQEPWLGTPKATNISRYAITGHSQQLLVINLHGVNFSLNSTALAQQLTDASAVVRVHQGPVIFSGDFNTWSDSRMDALQATMTSLKMEELIFREDQRKQVFGNALDHIFVRGLRVVEAGTATVTSSDHNPVFATLAVKS
jgi:endonuclease/exonuclease/phosphatase (EEP) superfamily protein YafD